MFHDKKISAIISVFNEERFIKGVVDAVLGCQFVNEIIIVDDGSTDDTPKILKKFPPSRNFKIARFEKNKGKSYAMAKGTETATGDIIVFIDADLIGLKCSHIKQVLLPLINGEADMVIGHPTENKIDEKFNPFQLIAGERAVFKKDILPILEKLRTTKYGFETMLNLYYKSLNKKIKIVYLRGLIHFIKFQKEKLPSSCKNYFVEALHILKTIAVNYGFVIVILRRIVFRD